MLAEVSAAISGAVQLVKAAWGLWKWYRRTWPKAPKDPVSAAEPLRLQPLERPQKVGYRRIDGKQVWAVKTPFAGIFTWTENQSEASPIRTVEGMQAVEAVAKLQPHYAGREIIVYADVKGRTAGEAASGLRPGLTG